MKKTKITHIIAFICLLLLVMVVAIKGRNFFVLSSKETSIKSGLTEEQQEFNTYLDNLFRQEIIGNTINLHYTLKSPENYGISSYAVTYGDINKEVHKMCMVSLENMQAALESFDMEKLTTEQQITYDILKKDIETEALIKDLYLYQEPLRASTGVQAELPILLAEYTFYDEQDVQDYLELLQQMPDYFKQILMLEMEKANEGLFMSEFAAESIINQCQNFIADKDNNYLISTFNDKIEAMGENTVTQPTMQEEIALQEQLELQEESEISSEKINQLEKEVQSQERSSITIEEQEAYKEKNKKLITENVIPAYEMLIQGLEKLKSSGKNQQGLYYLPKGVDYYEYLVKTYVGSDMTVDNMIEATKNQRAADITEAAKLLSENPDLLLETASYVYEQQEPIAILQELQKKMEKDFPKAPDTNFTIKYVHPSLEKHMAPAFYLSVPIDDISQNCIYINGSSNYQELKLYTTLAHEGFPGHLYQNIMERSQDFSAIRSILGSSGYSEGWATYVEMISYTYADIEPELALLLQKDQSALLSLYASADMGIHYQGWSLEEMMEFFGEYQITDKATLTEIYQLIVEEPAHYLKYYIGYLEFLNLKDYAKEIFGEQYSDYQFHKALMKLGPAPFSVLKKYLMEYY